MINGKHYLTMAINTINAPWWKKILIRMYGEKFTIYAGHDFVFDVYSYDGEEYLFNGIILQ